MDYDGDAISDSEWFAAECEDRDDDDEPNICYGCGAECSDEHCCECQEDGTEYFDRMNAAAESCGKSADHRTTGQS